MKHLFSIAIVSALVLAAPAVADAQERDAGIGVGVTGMLSGPVGPSLVYQTNAFHFEGILGFAKNGTTDFSLGGRFWYGLHQTPRSDFSVGGGLGFLIVDPDPGDSSTVVALDFGAQLRAFMVPNVAISASLGFTLLTGDADFVGITGDLLGSLGIHYFFF